VVGRQTGATGRGGIKGGIKTLARIFQALRIRVNSELDNLQLGLEAALEELAAGGVLAVISYHSLEDRLVKEFMVAWEKGCTCPAEWPECRCGRLPRLSRPFKRPIRPGPDEVRDNPRSRSARMRAAVKL
jgi:16S rRNA (cytosine1402-N4)-methyltransferase